MLHLFSSPLNALFCTNMCVKVNWKNLKCPNVKSLLVPVEFRCHIYFVFMKQDITSKTRQDTTWYIWKHDRIDTLRKDKHWLLTMQAAIRWLWSAKHNAKSKTTTADQKTQRQIKKHGGKSKNTTPNQKTQRQNRKHSSKSENTTTLTKSEKVGTLRRHGSSLIGLVRPLNRKDMVYMFSK